jgi:hypothetical protein
MGPALGRCVEKVAQSSGKSLPFSRLVHRYSTLLQLLDSCYTAAGVRTLVACAESAHLLSGRGKQSSLPLFHR